MGKKRLFWVVMLLCCVEGAWAQAPGRLKRVRVGIFQVEPLNYIDQDGKAQGINPDLLREIALQRGHWWPEFVPVTWAEGLELLENEELELMVSVTYTPERTKFLDFSKTSVLELRSQVFMRPGANVDRFLDFKGFRVGIMKEGIHGKNFINLADAYGIDYEVIEYDSHRDIFRALELNEIEAGVAPSHVGLRQSHYYNVEGTKVQFAPARIHFATKKGCNEDVLADIDVVLTEWQEDQNSYYYWRLDHWFGAEDRWGRTVPLWLKIAAGISVVTGFLFLILIWLFKRQVRLRTHELSTSEERYRMIVENQTDLVVKVDVKARFLYVSPSYCEVFGKTEKELLGNAFLPLVHEEDRASTESEFAKIFKPPHVAYMEQRAMTQKGWRWFYWQDSALLDEQGNVTEIIGVGRDITARKEAELAYRESNERLHLATQAAQIGIWEYDIANDQLIWDEQMFKLYDVDKASFSGILDDWRNTLHPEDVPSASQRFAEAMDSGEILDTEFRVIWSDESIHFIRSLAMIDRDLKGNPKRAIGTNWDVTRNKRMISAVQESEQNYRQLFENMTTGFFLFEVVFDLSDKPVNYKIVQANSAAEDITGAKRENMVGNLFTEVFQPMESYWMDILSKVVVTGKPSSYENRAEAVDRVLSTWIFVPKPGYVGVVFSDNTAHRTAEDAVLRAQQQLQHIFDNTKDIIFQIDLQGNYIYVNSAAEELTGYPVDELIGMNMMDLIVPKFHVLTEEWLKRRIDGDPEMGNFSFEILHREGHRIWLELAANGVFDSQGRLEAVQGVARDITERKEAEQALTESRRFLRTVIDAIPSRVFWKDLKSNYLGCNISFAEDAGFNEPDKLVGKSDYDLSWSKEDADEFRNDDYEVVSSGVPRLNIQERTIDPSGSINWLNTSKVPMRDSAGTVIGLLGTYENVTEQKLLQEDRLRLTAAINQSAEAIVVMDIEGVIQYVNPAFETITGHAKAKAIGENLSIINNGMQDDGFFSSIWKTLRVGNTWRGRIVNKTEDGGRSTFDTVISPVRDENKAIVNYVVTIHDITQELEMEINLRQAQKMDAVGRLAGGVAHDFNNILQSILGFSGILSAELESGTSQYNDVEEIRKAARRAGDLTRQLLILSRKQHVEYSVQHMNEIVKMNEGMMRRLLGERIEFKFELSEPLRPVHADRSQIEQILLNLFINARDAMPDGGCLSVRTHDLGDEITDGLDTNFQNAGGYICLTISDTGCGIRKEVQAHMFEPFYTTKQVGKGTGLGLSVVYGIIQQHAGRIDVSSHVGEGSEFKIYLPALDEDDAALKNTEIPRESAESPEGHGEKILVVEDDTVLRELSERMLGDAGYSVVSADGAECALELFKEGGSSIQLLYADVILPDGNGVELAEQLREMHADLAVLLCSGYSQDEETHATISTHGFHYLEKPVATIQLLQTIREMLDEKHRV